jgi:hypothetical protein
MACVGGKLESPQNIFAFMLVIRDLSILLKLVPLGEPIWPIIGNDSPGAWPNDHKVSYIECQTAILLPRPKLIQDAYLLGCEMAASPVK